jgi:uncharacterized protein (TIGR02266 family)
MYTDNAAPQLDRTLQTTAERRTQLRVDVELVVSIESDSNFFSGFSENISEGGLFIATYDYKPLGAVFALEFQLPELSHKIKTRVQVQWVREYNPAVPDMIPGMGVRFMDLDARDVGFVQRFCEQLREPMFIDLDF